MEYNEVLKRLKAMSEPRMLECMERFAITAKEILGVSMPNLRKLGKEIGKDHGLAKELWSHEILETRLLACLVDDPEKVTEKQMDAWIKDFDSWGICDSCCICLFDKTPFAYKKAFEWTKRKREFEKRTGFAMMARLAWSDKTLSNKKIEAFFPVLIREANDERNFVKKAVNWALRQIGKRNLVLNKKAIAVAKKIQKMDSKPAKWIAGDALRELQGDAVQKRLKQKGI